MNSYLSPTGAEIVFGLLGVVTLAAAVMVVTTRQLVHAALWLVVALAAQAGCYLVLTAEFLAWVQVLIYVGAIVVLLLFGLMLTRAPIGASDDLDSPKAQRIAALVVAGGLGAVLVAVLVDAFSTTWIDLEAAAAARAGDAEVLGSAIFRYWVLPFEALSVLLLAALIGAIVVSRSAPAAVAGDDRDELTRN